PRIVNGGLGRMGVRGRILGIIEWRTRSDVVPWTGGTHETYRGRTAGHRAGGHDPDVLGHRAAEAAPGVSDRPSGGGLRAAAPGDGPAPRVAAQVPVRRDLQVALAD